VQFLISGRFHVGYSLLGRWLQRRLRDHRRASARFIVVFAGLLAGLVIAQYLAWAILSPTIKAAPGGLEAQIFWYGQLGAGFLFFLTSILGFQPAIRIFGTADGLIIRRAGATHFIAYSDVERISECTPTVFYRHYALYAQTKAFVNRLEEDVLLIKTASGDVVIGLGTMDREALWAFLEARTMPVANNLAVQVA